MTLLNSTQTAYLATVRSRLWTRAFTIETTDEPRTTWNPYSSPSEPTVSIASGDWRWNEELERRGSPGGTFIESDLILNCSIVYSGALMHSGAQIRVDGKLLAITRMAAYLESQEIELHAKRVGT